MSEVEVAGLDSQEETEEESLSSVEEIKSRHRKEKKELQAKIQALKKSSSKGDKKKRKEVLEEITSLEADLENKHRAELSEVESKDPPPKAEKPEVTTPPQRISKAQKRRHEKEKKAKDRAAEIELAEEMNKFGIRQVESDKLKALLQSKGLSLKEIPGDGDCMFSAIADQVPGESVKSLRSSAARRLRQTETDVLPFMTKKGGGDELMSSEDFSDYCSALETRPDIWGGQVELNALSHVLERQIEVLQAEGAPVVLGEEGLKGERIILTYHRHMFGLGEHYNSVSKIKE